MAGDEATYWASIAIAKITTSEGKIPRLGRPNILHAA